MYYFLAFFWYKYYISILQIQICIILFDVPPLKHTKYNNLEYRVWVQWTLQIIGDIKRSF